MLAVRRQIERGVTEAEHPERASLAARFPMNKVEDAYRKFRWLARWRSLRQGPRLSLSEREIAYRVVAEARAAEGEHFAICVRSLQLWHRAYEAQEMEGLIDRRGANPKGGGAHEGRTQKAINYFYDIYHAGQQLTVATCHKRTLAEARKHDWHWPKSYGVTLKWLRKFDDLATSCARREGRGEYSRRFMPCLERDYTTLEPGEQYEIDHSRSDFWVQGRKEPYRPWLTAMIDERSRMIVGWHLGKTPHQDSILSAMRMAFVEFAVPQRLLMDHGKDFLSALITGHTKKEARKLEATLGRD